MTESLCKHDWVGDDNCAYCRCEALEAENAELKTLVERYSGLLDKASDKIDELKVENAELKKCLEGQRFSTKTANKRVYALKAENAELEAKLEQKHDDAVNEVRCTFESAAVNAWKESCEQLSSELEASQARVRELEGLRNNIYMNIKNYDKLDPIQKDDLLHTVRLLTKPPKAPPKEPE